MCIHLTILKIVYIITLSLFVLVFISDFIEINFRYLKKKIKSNYTDNNYLQLKNKKMED